MRRRKGLKKGLKLMLATLGILLGVAAVALIGFLFWASRGYDAEAPAQAAEVNAALLADGGVPGPSSTLRIVTFNVAYGRGPEDDIGDRRTEAEVRGFLDRLAAFLRAQDAPIVALQEVDRGARRTYGIDQLTYLADRAGYPYRAFVTTWRKNYVPFPYWPVSQHIGAIHSGQAVLSRYPIADNRRVTLPQPESNPFWYNAFYLNRAIQIATVEIGDVELVVFNCHLEAFDTPNREQHARLLVELVQAESPARWVVLGDMNALPPEAPRHDHFADEPDWDGSDDATVEILRRGLGAEHPGAEAYARNHETTFTFPAAAPSRRLDYIFASPSLPSEGAQVLREAGALSDHLPVGGTFRLR